MHQELVCYVGVSRRAEHVQQIRRAEEPSRQVRPGAHILHQTAGGQRRERVGEEIERERQRVRGLCVLADPARG